MGGAQRHGCCTDRAHMRNKSFFLVSILLMWGAASSLSLAQVTTNITPSGGLGTTLNGGVPACTSSCTITGGTRPGNGPNLFHSFGNFSVGAGDTANFQNTQINGSFPFTSNILSRVTGGNPSNIFGTIKTTDFGSANLFLINPAGVVFGPSAVLDIGTSMGTPGSFHVSTADYLRLGNLGAADAGVFSANALVADVLTSAPVTAFGFLDPNPAAVAIQGNTLQVGEGQTLSVVGGDVSMTGGTLRAAGGQINVASVASPGEVLLPDMQTAPNVNDDVFSALGTVNLSSNATLNVSGDGGGTIFIRGGQLTMDRAFLVANTTGGTDGAATAVMVDMDGDMNLSNRSSITSRSLDAGRSGDIVITAGNLELIDGSVIRTTSEGDGNAGSISITASNSVSISGMDSFGNPSRITSQATSIGSGGSITIMVASSVSLGDLGLVQTGTFGDGPSGDIRLTVGNIEITGGGGVETFGSDTAPSGLIDIVATGNISLSGQSEGGILSRIVNINDGLGGTGSISIEAGALSLTDGAQIKSAHVFSLEDPSVVKVRISANDSISISSGSRIDLSTDISDIGSLFISAPNIAIDGSGSVVNTSTITDGNAGAITLNGTNISISGGAQITSSTQDGAGRGGNTTIASGSVSISGTGSGIFSESGAFATGSGGDIQIQANQVNLNTGATISAQSTGTGNAGDIGIVAGDSLVMQSSFITTEAEQSDGGNIHIQVGRLVQLTDSRITTSVLGGSGNSGNITIDPQFVILQNSQIIANCISGICGDIRIVAGLFLADSTSTVSASSTFGVSGTVNIQATVSNLSESVAPLSGEFARASDLLPARCAARFNQSSLVLAGRDGLPLEPGGLLPSPLFVESPSSARLARALNIPDLRAEGTRGGLSLALMPLDTACAS